jgi:hypothetical protein
MANTKVAEKDGIEELLDFEIMGLEKLRGDGWEA